MYLIFSVTLVFLWVFSDLYVSMMMFAASLTLLSHYYIIYSLTLKVNFTEEEILLCWKTHSVFQRAVQWRNQADPVVRGESGWSAAASWRLFWDNVFIQPETIYSLTGSSSIWTHSQSSDWGEFKRVKRSLELQNYNRLFFIFFFLQREEHFGLWYV